MQDGWDSAPARALEACRSELMGRARTMIPIMDAARKAISEREERVTNVRLADYLNDKGIAPICGVRWNREAVRRLFHIDDQLIRMATAILAVEARERDQSARAEGALDRKDACIQQWVEARAAHNRAVGEAIEVAIMLR